MTTSDLAALLSSDLTSETNRKVLADALTDAGEAGDVYASLDAAYRAGREDGTTGARESEEEGEAVEVGASRDWDSGLANAVGVRAMLDLFLIPVARDDDGFDEESLAAALGGGRYTACLRCYDAAAREAWDEFAEESAADTVFHEGRNYRLSDLAAHMEDEQREEIHGMGLDTAQGFWDAFAERFPEDAARLLQMARPVGGWGA